MYGVMATFAVYIIHSAPMKEDVGKDPNGGALLSSVSPHTKPLCVLGPHAYSSCCLECSHPSSSPYSIFLFIQLKNHVLREAITGPYLKWAPSVTIPFPDALPSWC